MKKLLLIDTFNFLHRAYHALPKTFTDSEGSPTNAIYGVTSMLINIFDQLKPDYVVAAVDERAPTLRHEDFTGYKAHRRPMEDDLSSQIPKVFEIIETFGLRKVSNPGYEADDVIGTFVHNNKNKDLEIIIASNDRDLWQLLDKNVIIMTPSTKGDIEWIGEKEAIARNGFSPKQVTDYKGLRGDPSDNIPGVYGVGEKTAKKLIEEFGTVENIYKNIDKINPDSLRKKLVENYEIALQSKQLATIVTNVELGIDLDECKFHEPDKKAIEAVLTKYNFKSLIRRLGIGSAEIKENKKNDAQMSLF